MSLNLTPYFFGTTGNTGKKPTVSGATATSSGNASQWIPFGSTGWNTSTGWTSSPNSQQWMGSIKRIATYLIAVFIVVLILLLFIHYFIRPIFRTKPGAPGWITIPGKDDSVLFWEKGSTGPIPNDKLPILTDYYDYTLQCDFFITNPFQFSTRPRILLTRGGIRNETPVGGFLTGVLSQYNLAIALKPDTNDMIVSVLNTDKQMEVALLPNIPVQQPFRLTVVVLQYNMEVYLNGYLMRTITFTKTPLDVKGEIAPAVGAEANIARYRNLKVWPRILTTPEIREATPPLPSVEDMGGTPIPSSSTSTCPT